MWTAEETSNLIEGYRNFKCLWDAKHADYKNRIKKKDALIELGKMCHVSTAEVERKLANVNSQYRRERRNYKKFKKSGAASSFRPKWFGYNLMAFLRDKNKPRRTEEIGLDESSLMEVGTYFIQNLTKRFLIVCRSVSSRGHFVSNFETRRGKVPRDKLENRQLPVYNEPF